MLIFGRKLPNLCKKVALCRLGNLTWRLRKIKRRFGKIKRRVILLKRRVIRGIFKQEISLYKWLIFKVFVFSEKSGVSL